MVTRAANGMFGTDQFFASTSRRRHSQELHPDVVRFIEEELALGRSHRAISESTGVHRETVAKIDAGTHVSQLLGTRYERCSRGHLAIMPCRTCAAMDALADKKKVPAA